MNQIEVTHGRQRREDDALPPGLVGRVLSAVESAPHGTQQAPWLVGRILQRIGRSERPLPDRTALDAAVAELVASPPNSVAVANGAISRALRDSHYQRYGFSETHGDPPAYREADLALLAMVPELKHIFVFHHDGFLREAALRMYTEAARTSFDVAAIALRLNDWALPVRAAARRSAALVFPKTDAGLIVEALMFLLVRMDRWQRWRDDPAVLDALMARPDICERLAERFRTARSGPMSTLLRQACAWPGLDAALPRLAQQAWLSSVRATALRYLIEGRAVRLIGYRRDWVDKVYGLTRRVPVLAEREVFQPIDAATLIGWGAHDRSSFVRRVAADGLIQRRFDLDDALLPLIEPFAADKNPAVRERVEFIFKERPALREALRLRHSAPR